MYNARQTGKTADLAEQTRMIQFSSRCHITCNAVHTSFYTTVTFNVKADVHSHLPSALYIEEGQQSS